MSGHRSHFEHGGGDFRSMAEAMFATIDKNRFKELGRFYSPDCCYARPGFERVEGLAALIHFYENVRIIGSGRHQLRTVFSEGDLGVVEGRFDGLLRSGSPAHVEFCDLYRLNGQRRIVERTSFFFMPAV